MYDALFFCKLWSFVSPFFVIQEKFLIKSLYLGLQKLLKYFPFATKEIHKKSMLLTLVSGKPLQANLNKFINIVVKDIHIAATVLCG